MIASLRGVLLEKSTDGVVIECGGVGYAVMVTSGAMRALPSVGAEARLHIYTHAVQDGPLQLFGFTDADERQIFEALISVQGVGPKVGVAILSGLPASELVRAISGGDVARLTQIRGVGRKIAERLTVELREKIRLVGVPGARPSSAPPGSPATPTGRLGEVYAALVSLGYKPHEFESALARLDPSQPIVDLVKQALAALRKG